MQHIEKSRFTYVGESAHDREAITRPSLTFMQDAMRRLAKNRVALVCPGSDRPADASCRSLRPCSPGLIIASSTMATPTRPWAPCVTRPAPRAMVTCTSSAPIPLAVICGPAYGWAAGVSLTIAVVSALVDLVLGSIYGGISGYFGGTLDIIMMRLLEIINGIPYLIIVILLMMILEPGMLTIIIAYSLVGWIPMARLVRGQVVALKQQEYIAAAEAMGASSARIIARHLLPNTLSVVIVRVTLSIPSAIFSEAYLSYIGLGIPLPMCSWGSLAQLGIENFRIYPSQLMIPAICISLTMLAFNMFGDGLRDAFDPKLRR